MSDLEKDYEEIIKQRNGIIEEISHLEESEVIKRYLELRKQNESLYKKQVEMQKKIKFKNYNVITFGLIHYTIMIAGKDAHTIIVDV